MNFCIAGVDPGPTETAFCLVDHNYKILDAQKVLNYEFITKFLDWTTENNTIIKQVAIESIQSYGAMVGKSTFETCYMIGRIMQMCDDDVSIDEFKLYPRQEYANWICGCKADDARVRQALMFRFGPDNKGGPLEKLKGQGSDKRSAFAVAVYHLDRLKLAEAGR